MAILLDPTQNRAYDYNARGAVTNVVKMRADNPFVSERTRVMKTAMQRRGMMAGLGEGEVPATEAGFDWSKLLEKAGDAITPLITQGPAQTAPRIIVQQTGMSTTTKILIASGIGLTALLAVMMLKRQG